LPFHPATPAGTFGKSRPAPGQLVLLADAGFVAEPDLKVSGVDALLARDRVQMGWEAFLKALIVKAVATWDASATW